VEAIEFLLAVRANVRHIPEFFNGEDGDGLAFFTIET
jgi:hypothetical protein